MCDDIHFSAILVFDLGNGYDPQMGVVTAVFCVVTTSPPTRLGHRYLPSFPQVKQTVFTSSEIHFRCVFPVTDSVIA
jgi:hypothetical protein